MQPSHDLTLHVRASHGELRDLVEGLLRQAGFGLSAEHRPDTVQLIVDNPLLWAFDVLERVTSEERARTVVSTAGTHPVYLDCLGSYKPSGVFFHTDAPKALAAIYAASAGIASRQRASTLTAAELRVVRSLLKGSDTKAIARRLRIAEKTVNSHVSSVLGKLGYADRAQMIARVLGNCPYGLG